MPLTDLHHVALRTGDLEASEQFYTEVLGMEKVDRPDFDFPGAWLQMGETMFHLMAGYAALGPDGKISRGSGAVDHLAIQARGFDEMREKFEFSGVEYKENNIQDFGIWQLFVNDPDGVIIELNFQRAGEPEGSRGPGQATLSKTT